MNFVQGQSAEISRSFSGEDIADYVSLGGQRPADNEVPEPLIGALFSYLLGVKLPGRGTNYLKQHTVFSGRALAGDVLTARVEITRLRPEKHLVDLRTTCSTRQGALIADGRALVYVQDATG